MVVTSSSFAGGSFFPDRAFRKASLLLAAALVAASGIQRSPVLTGSLRAATVAAAPATGGLVLQRRHRGGGCLGVGAVKGAESVHRPQGVHDADVQADRIDARV